MFERRTIILLTVAATVILALLLYLNQLDKGQYDWNETYSEESTEPYGTSAFYQYMKGYFENEDFKDVYSVDDDLPIETEEKANYLFLGYGLYLDSLKSDRLLQFVENGNDAMILARFIPPDLVDKIFDNEDCAFDYTESFNYYMDSTLNLSLVHPMLKNKTSFKYIYDHTALYREHQHINWDNYCMDAAAYLELGYINDSLANFARVPYGDGYFYFHTTPFVFSNFHVLERKNRQYVNKVLAHLDEGAVYWDQQNNVLYKPPRIEDTSPDDYTPTGPKMGFGDQTPLQYILSQRSLRWAWYLLLSTGLLYLLFRAKRKQRIIPVLEQNTNTSLEFVETIGMLYWQQNDHRQLALQQMRLFINHVKTRYHILLKHVDEEQILRLAAVSNVPVEHFNNILDSYKNIKNSATISEKELVSFYQLIEYYYQNCK